MASELDRKECSSAETDPRSRLSHLLGSILAAGYFVYVYRSFADKVVVNKDSHGYGG